MSRIDKSDDDVKLLFRDDAEIFETVYDALLSRKTRVDDSAECVSGADAPLFELSALLQRIDDIDRRRGTACNSHENADAADSIEVGDSAPLQLTPERFVAVRSIVVHAYADVRNGCSADRLVADDSLNDEFLRRCWELGAQATAYELNWHLLNARKSGKLRTTGGSKRFVIPSNRLTEFAFATEFAIRHMQELHARQYLRRVSLDRILCDPSLATEFDSLAQRIAPGYSSLEYRWAAFTIRKARRPYIGSPRLSFEHVGSTRGVRLNRLPSTGGLYRFLSGTRELYVGETSNIRQQIEIHLDNNGTAIFPDWMEARLHEPIELLVAELPDNPSGKERGRLKTFYTDRFMPHFNWLGAGIVAA